jgi:hypothetical protein
MSNSVFPLVQINKDKEIVSANQIALNMLFYPSDKILGEPLFKFIREVHSDFLSLPFEQLLEEIKSKPSMDCFINKSNRKIKILFQPIVSLDHRTELNCILDCDNTNFFKTYQEDFNNQTELETYVDIKTNFKKIDDLQQCILQLGSNPKENIKKLINCSKDVTFSDLILYQKINNQNIRIVFSNNQNAEIKSARVSLNSTKSLEIPGNFVTELFCENGDEGEYKAYAKIPVIVDEKKVGILSFYYNNPRKFSVCDKNLLLFLGKIIAIEEEKYMQQEKLRKVLILISHEIRQPLCIVKGFAELIPGYKESKDPEISQQIIQGIKSGTSRLNHLLNEFTIISELFNQDSYQVFREYFVQDIICEALSKIKDCEARKRIQLDYEIDVCCTIVTNKEKLVDLLAILLDNALKFSKPEKKVIINIKKLSETLKIDVIDNGIGLKPENIKNLFNKINVPDEINTYSGPGIGLGLYIASMLIDQIQGKIEYFPNPKNGSIFSVALPSQK